MCPRTLLNILFGLLYTLKVACMLRDRRKNASWNARLKYKSCVFSCVNALRRLGDVEYPDLGTFNDALDIAQEAIDQYGGVIPNDKAAEKLGYKVKDPKKISGNIYRRLGDLSKFGLFEKIRGGYRTTELAEKALDPYDSASAVEGKADAVRNIPIVEKAFTQWNGDVPPESAFPARLQALIGGISWKEAQNHAESLRKLFIECFPYLRPASERKIGLPVGSDVGGDIMSAKPESRTMTVTAKGLGFGITKTLPFTKKGIQDLRELIDFLETQLTEETIEEQIKSETVETD